MRALLVALAVAACGTGTTYRTTRTAPRGHTEWLFGAQVSGGGARGAGENGEEARGAAPLPEAAVGARYGVTERIEAQLNGTLLPTAIAQTGSLELAGKVRLVEHGRWSLAAGAGAGYRLSQAGGAIIEDVFVSAPVIGGVELGRHQLVLSLHGGYHRLYSSGAHPVNVPYVGQSIGFRWQIGRAWALLPELGGAWSPARNVMTEDSRLFHVGIAALWTR